MRVKYAIWVAAAAYAAVLGCALWLLSGGYMDEGAALQQFDATAGIELAGYPE